jgi:peptide/nickel transport system substrate-binding protein
MKRVCRSLVAVGVFAAVAAGSAGCGRREVSSPPTATISRHLVGDPVSLDPTTILEEEPLRVSEMMFRPLLGIDQDLRLVPALAKSWTVSEDGLTFEFHLDPSATWEDGKSVTSDDVRFTIERIHDPKVNAASWSWGFEDLAGIETPDPSTVRIRFRTAYSERILAFALPIVSAAAYARAKPGDVDRRPVGSGPYRLVSWDANRTIRLTRRPDAPADRYPYADVVFRVIPDDSTRFQAGARGDLDEFRISRDQRKATEGMPDFLKRIRVLKVAQPAQVVIIWNTKTPFLSDARVRRALAHAWPRADAAMSLYQPDGAALISGPYPPGVAANAPDVAPPAYDPAESARLLDAAGWKMGPDGVRRKGGQKARIELVIRAQARVEISLAEILRSAYEKVGVELVPVPLEAAVYSERGQEGHFDAYLTGRFFLPPNFDPYPYWDSSQWAPRGQNMGFYKNPEADRLMLAARLELDTDKRIDLYRQIHRIIAADQPGDFLWGADQYWGVARRVDDVELSPLGLFHFEPGPLGWRPAPAAAR